MDLSFCLFSKLKFTDTLTCVRFLVGLCVRTHTCVLNQVSICVLE